jgi:hypothetical protein
LEDIAYQRLETKEKYLPASFSVIPWWVSSRSAVIGTEGHEAGKSVLAAAALTPGTPTTQPDNSNLYSFLLFMDMESVCTCALGSLSFHHLIVLGGISMPKSCHYLPASQPFPAR